MTPFGVKIRELRAKRGLTLKKMAADLHLSAAYVSALEHGRRGLPSPGLVMEICGAFGIIWDEAEELKKLAALSHPKPVINTVGLSPKATELANRLAQDIGKLNEEELDGLLELLHSASSHKKPVS